MPTTRIALANLRFPPSPGESVARAVDAVAQAGRDRAAVVCFPECFVPGYRGMGHVVPPADPAFLERAWSEVAGAAARAGVAVVLGTERVVQGGLRITALVVGADGSTLGWQDKVQLDPSEEGRYAPGTERRVFKTGSLTFGVAIRPAFPGGRVMARPVHRFRLLALSELAGLAGASTSAGPMVSSRRLPKAGTRCSRSTALRVT